MLGVSSGSGALGESSSASVRMLLPPVSNSRRWLTVLAGRLLGVSQRPTVKCSQCWNRGSGGRFIFCCCCFSGIVYMFRVPERYSGPFVHYPEGCNSQAWARPMQGARVPSRSLLGPCLLASGGPCRRAARELTVCDVSSRHRDPHPQMLCPQAWGEPSCGVDSARGGWACAPGAQCPAMGGV